MFGLQLPNQAVDLSGIILTRMGGNQCRRQAPAGSARIKLGTTVSRVCLFGPTLITAGGEPKQTLIYLTTEPSLSTGLLTMISVFTLIANKCFTAASVLSELVTLSLREARCT